MARGNNTAPAPDIQQLNAMARSMIVNGSIKMEQTVFTKTVDPANENVLNIAPRYAGLLLGFIVEVETELENDAAATAAADRTIFGTANLVDEIRFEDLSNYTRIQVPGWYLALLNTVRQGFEFGGIFGSGVPMGYGDNYGVYDGPATIADGGTEAVRQVYYVPIAYSATDLRGAIWSSIVNATMNLQITLNQTPGYTTGSSLKAVYGGANTVVGYASTVTVRVTQIYLDQLPKDARTGQVILPPLDLNMVYDLKQTTYPAITAGQDNPFAYSNFRQFLSTIAVYENGTAFNAGTDVNYWSLASANFTNIFKYGPKYSALKTRQAIMTDMPAGVYLFNSRDIPINTINFGNMELNLNPITAAAGARVLIGYEAFGLVNQLVGASSLNLS